MNILDGKSAIIIGDRDGVSALPIELCVESAAGSHILYSCTEMYPRGAGMDTENRERLRHYCEAYGAETLLILIGAAEAETAHEVAKAAYEAIGDGATVYHVSETAFSASVDPEVYEEWVRIAESVLDVNAIRNEMQLGRLTRFRNRSLTE